MKHTYILTGLLIFLLSASMRLYGIGWDQGTHTHPDERFLTMVINKIDWPTTVLQYFDTHTSPLNPHNNKFSFYVYGTWPIIAAKSVAQAFNRDTYDLFPLVGRVSVVFADLATLLMVFLITKTITKHIPPALLSMFLYGIATLPIQLTHFFTVDPFAVLYLTIATYLMIKNKIGAPLGVSMGLAIGAKISSVLMLPIIGIHYILAWPWSGDSQMIKATRIRLLIQGVLFGIVLLATVRIVYPYLFVGATLNPKVLANWRELSSFDSPTTSFPPGLQWIGTPVFFYSLKQLIVWGLGLPYGLVAITALVAGIITTIKNKKWNDVSTICLIIVGFFSYQSFQFAKALRYFAPIYPHIAVISGIFLYQLTHSASGYIRKQYIHALFYTSLGLLLLWPVMFTLIYTRPNTRVAASDWMYANIPKKSTIAWEHWDDPLPISRGENSIQQYKTEQLAMFAPDSPKKWREITQQLERADYIVLSSNRVYGGTGQVKKRFPQTYAYYQKLFSGELGFSRVHQEVSRPFLPLPNVSVCVHVPFFTYGSTARSIESCQNDGIYIVDDYADETFTVYDHPKVLIFKNESKLTANQLYMNLLPN